MVSASKASWVVAASMAAVEALKDQVGLCRWNYAMRSLQQHAKANLPSLKTSTQGGGKPSSSATTNQVRRFSSAMDHPSNMTSMKKKREAEKAENVMHLVCWGPN